MVKSFFIRRFFYFFAMDLKFDKVIKFVRFSLSLLTLIITGCYEVKESRETGVPVLEIDKTDFDFGLIQMGEKVVHRFVFKNKGTGDLVIKNVDSDCGCTAVDYEKNNISPGKESYIEVEFDSEGLPGSQIKKMLVKSNANDSVLILTVSANVNYDMEKVN